MSTRAKITLLALIVIGLACYAGWRAHEQHAAARRVAQLQHLVEREHALMQSNQAMIAALQARAAIATTATSARVSTSPAAGAPP